MPGGTVAPWNVVASWPTPNYDHPVKKGDALTVISIVLAVITVILVVLRLWTRIYITKQPGLDDVFVVLGLVFGIAFNPLIVLGYKKYGIGIHKWDLNPTKAVMLRKFTFYAELLFVWSISCTKISILLLYRRLAAGAATKTFIWGTYIGVVYNVAYCFTYTFLPLFMCHPVDAYWNQFDLLYDKKWSCVNEGYVLPFGAALSTVSDIYGCLLPLLLLRYLQMPWKQKALLYSLFALGWVVVASGIVRTYYLVYLFHYTYDITWDLWDMFIWLTMEVYVAIICAGAPALKPLYTRFIAAPINKLYNSYQHTKRSHNTSTGVQSSTGAQTVKRRDFENLETGGAVKMGIFVRNDVETASEHRGSSEGDGSDHNLVLPRQNFSYPGAPRSKFAISRS